MDNLYLTLPFSSRRFRAPAQPTADARASKDWHTPDGVDIWQARALYQPRVEVLEGERPLRVVLLQDYEALARLLAAHGPAVEPAGPDMLSQHSIGAE
jgi:hypothetical protein